MKKILLSIFVLCVFKQDMFSQITNGTINYELRIDQWSQSCDNDALSADDNEVRVGLVTDLNTGGTAAWSCGGSGASCGCNYYVRRWQSDAPSTITTSNLLMYNCLNRSGTASSFTITHNSWEEDGSPDCDPSGDACTSSGTYTVTYRSTSKTPCRWWGYSGTADAANWVTGLSGNYSVKTVWRYSNGASCGSALAFGTLTSGTTYTHTNSNRVAPTGASADKGYTNVAGNAAPDVYYSFTVSTPSSVTISTANTGTNYDTYLRLYNSTACGTEIASNDDAGGNTTSIITTDLCAGTYVVLVEGFSANSGDFVLSVRADTKAMNGGTIAGISDGLNICSGTDPGSFTSATDATGAGALTYQWESSTTSSSSGFSDISGAAASTYDPGALTTTTWYRRRATDGCSRVAYSNVIQIVVQSVSSSPTGASASNGTICSGGSSVLSSSGGSAGYGANLVWYSGLGCPPFTQDWVTQPYGVGGTTVNSVTAGVLNVSSTNGDPMIYMDALGSFDPAIYKFVNIRYRVISGTAGSAEIFFYNGSHNFALGGESAAGALISDGAWHVLSIDMSADPDYTAGGNIVGWRFDWAGNASVNMEIDYINLATSAPLSSATVSPTTTTTYSVRYEGQCNATSCVSTSVTVTTDPTAPSISGFNITPGTTMCTGQTISATTLTAGSGGTGCSADAFEYSNDGSSYAPFAASTSYTPSGSTFYVRARRACGGNGCNPNPADNLYTWTVVADPIAPSVSGFNIAPGTTVCTGQTISATTLTAGSGGTGCSADAYQYSNDGTTYSTFAANTAYTPSGSTFYVRARRACGGNGCNPNPADNLYTWTVVADPVAPSVSGFNITPGSTICSGQTISATTLNAGSGGTGCSADVYQYSNDGTTYNSFVAGTSYTPSGSTFYVRARRACSGNGCNPNPADNLYTWTVVADPTAPSVSGFNIAPGSTICTGQTISATTLSSGSGGTGCSADAFEYSNDGSSYAAFVANTSYTPSGSTFYVRARRACSGSGCNPNPADNLYSWTIVADPTAPSVSGFNIAPGSTICTGQPISATTLNAGSGGTGCSADAFEYSNNGTSYVAFTANTPYTPSGSTFYVRARRACSGSGCNPNPADNLYTWTIVADPTAPSVTGFNIAPGTTICTGQTISATTLTSGSGGTGCSADAFEYSNDGTSYAPFAASTSYAPSGSTFYVRARRACSGNGCNPNPVDNLYTWTIVADPVAASITKSPNASTVCAGTSVSATIGSFSGGTGVITDVIEYSTNGGTSWSTYTSGSTINTTGLSGSNIVQIRTTRTASGASCNTASNLATWSVDAMPVISGPTTICDDETNLTFTNDLSSTNWSVSPGTLGSISSAGIFNPNNVAIPTQNASGNIQVVNGTCTANFSVLINNKPTITSSGANLCETSTRTLTSDVNGVTFSGTGVALSGGNYVFTAPDPGSGNASAPFTITCTNGTGCQVTQTITVDNNATITSSSADMCEGSTRTVSADFGPGTWTADCGTCLSGTTFTAPTPTLNTTISTLTYTVTGSTCGTAKQDIIIYHLPSTSNAGTDITITCGPAVTLQAISPAYGSGSWGQYTGSGTTTFANAASPTSATTVTALGSYQYIWTVSNGPCTANTDTMAVTYTANVSPSYQLDDCMNSDPDDNYYVLINATQGTSPYTFGGTPVSTISATEKLYEQLQGTTATYTVTDYNGCINSVNVTTPSGHPVNIPFSSTNGSKTVDCYDKGINKWVTFRDNNNDAILSIQAGAVDLGLVNVTVFREGAEPVINPSNPATNCANFNDLKAMKRHFLITASNYPYPAAFPSNIGLRLYFSDAELQSLIGSSIGNNAPGDLCSTNDDINSLNDLYVTKYSGPQEDSTYNNNQASGVYRVYGSSNSLGSTDGPLAKSSGGFSSLFTSGPSHHYVELSVDRFSEIWLHGSAHADALPVEMISFEAIPVNNSYIQLNWSTAVEINNQGFEIQRSLDGINFASIGWVNGHNNSTVQQNYTYNDVVVEHGTRYYYRLKQVDNDGQFEYSTLVSAILQGENTFQILDFVPNPATNGTELYLTSGSDQTVNVEIYNILGAIVISREVSISKGGNIVAFDLSTLASGTYAAIVKNRNEIFSKKLVIER